MTKIEAKYREKCATPSDIFEHLPTLRRYAGQCEHVTELGVRTVVSTWALLAGLQECEVEGGVKALLSVDLAAPEAHGGNLPEVCDAVAEHNILARGGGVAAPLIRFNFIAGDDRKMELEETDLLFIDTWHVYEQLKTELALHAGRARKWIILHDTQTFGITGETAGHRGLLPALEEFLDGNPVWRRVEHFTNCNGLTILERLKAKG